MRTLKKTLAFVLVLAMVLSLGTIGASAAFTDTDDAAYPDAIDVLSGIGVIDGMGDGTFDPDGSLTRAQAAKIIAYMLLGPANAKLISTATSQKFSDVAVSHWAAGYIEYCTNLGIIAGVGDGKFDPDGALTTCAFAKMLLCALGYKADVEGLVGESWAINTASLAVGAGITDPAITLSSVTPCTREQACQLAFKALTATMVYYEGGSTVIVGGVTVTTGAVRKSVPNTSGTGYLASGNDQLMQFCESKFPSLKRSTAPDAFGRDQYIWKLGQTVISSSAAKTPVLVYTENMDTPPGRKKIASDTKNLALPDDNIKAQINGEDATEELDSFSDLASLTGNGVRVEVYAIDGVITEVIVTEETLATIKKIDTKNEKITVAYNGYTTSVESGDLFYDELSEFAVNDYVLVVLSKDDDIDAAILGVAEPETVTGKYTAKNTILKTYTIGGTVYNLAKNGEDAGLAELGNSYTVILDSYGYIIKAVDTVVSTSDYAYVLAASRDGTARTGYTYSAQLLHTDGSIEWVDVSSVDGVSVAVDPPADFYDGDFAGNFVSYSEAADGSYEITVAERVDNEAEGDITKGTASILTTYTATNSTVFLIADADGVYTAYTGIKNVPSMRVAKNKAAVLHTDNIAKIVVVKTGATTALGNFVYIYDDGDVGEAVIAGAIVKYYKAIIDGEITTVGVREEGISVETGLYENVVYTGDYISDLGEPVDKIENLEKYSLASGLLTLDKTGGAADEYIITADGFAAFEVNLKTETAAEFDMPATLTPVDEGIEYYVTTDINGHATAFYVVTPASGG